MGHTDWNAHAEHRAGQTAPWIWQRARDRGGLELGVRLTLVAHDVNCYHTGAGLDAGFRDPSTSSSGQRGTVAGVGNVARVVCQTSSRQRSTVSAVPWSSVPSRINHRAETAWSSSTARSFRRSLSTPRSAGTVHLERTSPSSRVGSWSRSAVSALRVIGSLRPVDRLSYRQHAPCRDRQYPAVARVPRRSARPRPTATLMSASRR